MHCGVCVDEQPRPVSHWGLEQTTASQAAPGLHLTSQPQEVLQSIARHEAEPVQVTSHRLLPQSRLRHEPAPVHAIEHDAAFWQSIPPRHEFVVVQPMLQFHPVGHTRGPLQLLTAQSIVQVCDPQLQLVHCAGHTFIIASTLGASLATGASTAPPGATQKPPVHVLPPLQSDCLVQA